MKKVLILIKSEQYSYDEYSTHKHESYIELHRDYHTAMKRCEELNKFSEKIGILYDEFYYFIFKGRRRTILDEVLDQYLQENNIVGCGYMDIMDVVSGDEIVRLLSGENVLNYLMNNPQLPKHYKSNLQDVLKYIRFFNKKGCKIGFNEFLGHSKSSGYDLPKFSCIKLDGEII